MAKIFIPTPLRKFTADRSTIEVEADSVAGAIEQLAQQFPELDQHLFDQERNIRKFVRIFIGDQDIHQLNGAATPVRPGDEISIIPAIAGGANS